MEQGFKTADRNAVVKFAKALAKKNPNYEYRGNPSGIYVTDMNRDHLRGSIFFNVFCAYSSGKRTQAEIAANAPIMWTVTTAERHFDEASQ